MGSYPGGVSASLAEGAPAPPGPLARRRRGCPRPPVLLVAGFTLLLAAWVGANPLGMSPDEDSHYVKEVAAGIGQWSGRPARIPDPDFGSAPGERTRIAWIDATTRAFRLPAGLSSTGLYCGPVFTVWRPLRCVEPYRPVPRPVDRLTYVGSYEPYVYALPGVVMARLGDERAARYAGRAVTAALTAGLLAVAAAAAWDRRAGPLSLLGLALAASPMLLFLGASLGTNGLEAAGSLCLFALVLRGARPGGAPRWLWPAVGVAGPLTAASRSTGPVWVLCAALLALAVHGPRPALRAVRTAGRRLGVLAALGCVGVGLAATLAWELAVQPHPRLDLRLAVAALDPGRLWDELRWWAPQWVGAFGWASVRMPSTATRVWLVLAILAVVGALVWADRRQRVLLGGVLLGVSGLLAALDALVFTQTRFPVYGRYLLPVVVVVPLLAGEVLTRRAERVPVGLRRLAPPAVVLAMAAVHLVGTWFDARRYAVGVHGPVLFLRQARWHPPAGFGPWLALAAAGGLALTAAMLPPALHRLGAADTARHAPSRSFR